MSFVRLRLAALFITACACSSGCMLKVALDSPSKPLERLADNAERLTVAAEEASGGIQTVSHEVKAARAKPDLGSIYNRVAQSADKDRNPVIVIPGILGTRLVDESSDDVVWGEFGRDAVNPETPQGARLVALPMQEGAALKDLPTTVKIDGALSVLKINVLGLPIEIGAYRDILTSLGVGGYSDSRDKLSDIDYGDGHYTCFQFGYDWRKDNAENARRLHEFILEKKAYVEGERIKRYGTSGPVRFDIVAHSMGGLLARYYLMYGPAELPAQGTPVLSWSGAQHVEKLVQVGTPNAGSAKTLNEMVEGVKFLRFLPQYDPAILGTMPAVYQLLPRTRHQQVIDAETEEAVDLMNPTVWEKYRWGLLDPKQDPVLQKLLPTVRDPQQRRRIAADHLRKCLHLAERFHAAIDFPATPPKGTSIHLVAGDATPTLAKLLVHPNGDLEPAGNAPGDGSVTRASALMDERLSDSTAWTPRLSTPVQFQSVTFLFANHLGLTSDEAFTDNVLFLLLEAPR